MATKPTEMCVVEKSGAREYKVIFALLFFVFPMSRASFNRRSSFFHHRDCVANTRFLSLSLSLCRRRRALSLSPSRRRRLEIEGGGRTTRAVGARVDDFVVGVSVVPKVGREETRAARERLD